MELESGVSLKFAYRFHLTCLINVRVSETNPKSFLMIYQGDIKSKG